MIFVNLSTNYLARLGNKHFIWSEVIVVILDYNEVQSNT